MSLTKKDPSLRVAANDPHLVSLGGGRLSTAVTIHNIPIGDTTIGSSPACNISINGTGVKPVHCTIYRSEENEVTLVPERNVRILIDGTKINQEANLVQGAMITIGNSNYLRFNNPAEAKMIRSAMGSNERISMPQIDFATHMMSNNGGSSISNDELQQRLDIDSFYETNIQPGLGKDPLVKGGGHYLLNNEIGSSKTNINNIAPIDINGLQCPKVFTADLVTVNMPAKDVLGQKFANFAKNLAENHRHMEKNVENEWKNNQMNNELKMTSTSTVDDAQNQPNGGSSNNSIENRINIPTNNSATSSFARQNFDDLNVNRAATSATPSPTKKVLNDNHRNNKMGQSTNQDHHHQIQQTSLLSYTNPTTATATYGGAEQHQHQHQQHQQQQQQQKFSNIGYLTEMHNGRSGNSSPLYNTATNSSRTQSPHISSTENERLEDMLKICTEYADRQSQHQYQSQSQTQYHHQGCNSITSSPIVQNRIKTNGSLPREKKSPFHSEHLASTSTTSSGQMTQGLNQSMGFNNENLAPNRSQFSTGYENVRIVGQNRVAISSGSSSSGGSPSCVGTPAINKAGNQSPLSTRSGYENVSVVGKYVPQSPRTKIRTTCMSPKKEVTFGVFGQTTNNQKIKLKPPPPPPNPKPKRLNDSEYKQLIKTFEEKLQIEMQAIEESSRYRPPIAVKPKTKPKPQMQPQPQQQQQFDSSTIKRTNININNLSLNIKSATNSPQLQRKPAPAPRTLPKPNKTAAGDYNKTEGSNAEGIVCAVTEANADAAVPIEINIHDVEKLKENRKDILIHLQKIKTEISELQKQEDEILRDLNFEKALLTAELTSVRKFLHELEIDLQELKTKIHRLEAQRNANRVMEENQQAKLKQSIEMKQDQINKLNAMLKQKPNNACLKDELENVFDSLENDRKTFEDLEFQYLEEESEWHAYREDLSMQEKQLKTNISEKHFELQQLENNELSYENSATTDAKTLTNNLIHLLTELKKSQNHLRAIESKICELTGQLHFNSTSSEDDESFIVPRHANSNNKQGNYAIVSGAASGGGVMSQSLFGSTELLCPKQHKNDDIMSKSVNDNIFYNNKIELPACNALGLATSTPKRSYIREVINENTAAEKEEDDVFENSPKCTNSHDVQSTLLRAKNNLMHNSNTEKEGGEVMTTSQVRCNLSLDSDAFEVNPLEKRVPSQDDIDRISKVTNDAPISTMLSTKGATNKIFDSIKEIERNRQLLLAQQGHHVIEHERQKMNDLKKRSHDAARAQYLSMLKADDAVGNRNSNPLEGAAEMQKLKESQMETTEDGRNTPTLAEYNKKNKQTERTNKKASYQLEQTPKTVNKVAAANTPPTAPTAAPSATSATSTPAVTENSPNLRHSQPEFETLPLQQQQQQQQTTFLEKNQNLSQSQLSSPRPLSDANSEISCDLLSADSNNSKSNFELSTTSTRIGNTSELGTSPQTKDTHLNRSSVNSNDTASGGSGSASGGHERKRPLPRHQRPLTRYLPIYSPDLNLRQHIESAGHQIALCPHVFVDAYSCRGYLHKLGATFHGWARRWFVLDRQRNAFIYYSDKSERKPRGGAYFTTIDEVYLDHLNASKSGRPHSTLIVKTKKRSYHLQAASDAAARIWIDAIITGAQGNLDY